MKSKPSGLTIILICFAVVSIIFTSISYISAKFKYQIQLNDALFELSKGNMDIIIAGINMGFESSLNESVNEYNRLLADILQVEKNLQQIEKDELYQRVSDGGAEFVLSKIKSFKEVELDLMNEKARQAILSPSPENATIDDSEPNFYDYEDKTSYYGFATLILIFLAILSWKFDNLKKKAQSS